MKLWDCIVTAIRALFSNKLRSILTMLGILIGVGAVVSVVSLGQAQEAGMEEAFASLGSNMIYVVPGAPSEQGYGGLVGSASTLTEEDAEAIAHEVPSVAGVAPVAETYAQIVAGKENVRVMVAGITPEYRWVNNLNVAQGSFITEYDYGAKSRVAVLGSEIAETLFGEMDPTGQSIRIDGRKFEVIGVLESKGTGFGTEDLTVYAPLSTYQSTLKSQQLTGQGQSIQAIAIQARSKDEIDSAIDEITELLRERHRIREGEEEDFRIVNLESIASQAGEILGLFRLILAAIAGISLLVGGIGIMNIMLVSVTERIREIGLRKAVGAKRRDILIQFLTEAATLSFCGGALGVGLGWIVIQFTSIMLEGAGFPINVLLSGGIVGIALGVAIFVGLTSGLYPAVRAARLDPIESLRHE
jgi:putative ABC transport system permease protein